MENIGDADATLYYQVTYETDRDVDGSATSTPSSAAKPASRGYTHVILDGIAGRGHYVGTYLAWGVNSPGWWGEGELKIYLDGDDDYPTICGTGTEDYFGGAWNFDVPGHGYTEYTTPYLGMPQVLRPDGLYQSQQRFGLYRWHVLDPIHFASDLVSRSRRWVGSPAAATVCSRTTSPRRRCSISISPARGEPSSHVDALQTS